MVLVNSILCLALNIYFEARSEPAAGQVAVSQVVINRVKCDKWPNTICDVVKEQRQFSWYSDGKSDKPKNINSWINAINMAQVVYDHYYKNDHIVDITNGAVYYHATWIQEKHNHVNYNLIGDHIFYGNCED